MPVSYTTCHKYLITKQCFSIFMDLGNFDEECLLKVINCSKLSAAITKLTFSWNNYSNPVLEAHELMDRYQKLSLEILEYEQRIGSKLGKYQRNKLDDSMEDLVKVIPYLENKIEPSESLEIVDKTNNSLV